MGLGYKQDLETKVANYGKRQAIALRMYVSCKVGSNKLSEKKFI